MNTITQMNWWRYNDVEALKPPPSVYVSRAEFSALAKRLAKLEAAQEYTMPGNAIEVTPAMVQAAADYLWHEANIPEISPGEAERLAAAVLERALAAKRKGKKGGKGSRC